MSRKPVAPFLIAKDAEGQFRITIRDTRFDSEGLVTGQTATNIDVSQKMADSWQEALGAKTQPAFLVLPLEHGFTTADIAVLTEQDMLGDRLVRRAFAVRSA